MNGRNSDRRDLCLLLDSDILIKRSLNTHSHRKDMRVELTLVIAVPSSTKVVCVDAISTAEVLVDRISGSMTFVLVGV